ncbi:MAG: hypothetical protein ACFE8L_14160 [Candidatus Hodarchaeota archaeon]
MSKHPVKTEAEDMLNFKSFYLQNRIDSLLKTPMLYALVINILIRIPYFPHAQGDDAFVVAWMAQAIQEGFIDAWIIHPLSIFGLYPYSFYPIGGPFILSMIFNLGFNIETAFLIFSYLFAFISLVTTYYLGKLIFPDDQLSIFFLVVFYTTSPFFLGYTYWTATVRGPFTAILPLTLYFLLKLISELNVKNILGFFGSFVLLALMHRLIILYPIFIISFICAILLIKVNLPKQKALPIFFLLYIFAFFLGILILPINPWEVTEFIFNNDSIIGIAWNLAIDYALKFGIISLLVLWGFFKQFSINELEAPEPKIHLFFLFLGLLLVFISPISTYATTVLLPWFGYYAVLGLKSIQMWKFKRLKYLIGIFPFFFGLFYSLIVVDLPIHLLGALILAIVTILVIMIKPSKNIHWNKDFYLILCTSIFIFSKFSTDGLVISSDFPFNYVSDDEFIIAEYLEKNNGDKEIIVSYDALIARRIQAISFQPVLRPINYPANLYYGWISIEKIRNETVFDISQLLRLDVGIPFNSNLILPENLFYNISHLNLKNSENIDKILDVGIRYIISNNPISGNSTQQSTLFTSISEVGILRVETRYLRLYEVPDKFCFPSSDRY